MNKLIETIEWAHIMGYEVRRHSFPPPLDGMENMREKVNVHISPQIQLVFWFDSEHEVILCESQNRTVW